MNLRNRPVRVVAAVGAVVAAGTTTFMALAAGSASADEPGRCTQNVNVREEPDATSRIVALCEAGTQVMLGAERNGWVRLDEQGGWASKEFVKADQPTSSSSSSSSSGSGSGSSSERDGDGSSSSGGSSREHSSDDSSSRDRSEESSHHESSDDRNAHSARSEAAEEAADNADDLGGLLG